MRTFFSLFSLVALATTGVFSTPVPESECLSELCGTIPLLNSSPSPSDVAASIAQVGTPTRSLSERDTEQLTNAERFIRGLPPKKPKHLRGSPARRSQPSVAPVTTYRGKIRVDRADNGQNLGYLSSHPFSGAQHRYQSIDNAAIVNFKYDDTQSTGPASELMGEFKAVTIPTPTSLLGPTTSPGATPQSVPNSYSAATGTSRTAESEVWILNRDTNELTMQWLNTDGSKPTMQLFAQSTALYAGGDQGSFVSRYPSPVTTVKYTFVPL
ncbi:hypothetical protein FS837_012516 [Tulasnella sp. UAMH 9824]|nr:hypothetical protein FS837_012516 [Tulasnella sp. UAMH 9824]